MTKETRTIIASPIHDQTDYQSDNESQSSEIVPDTWSMEKATNEVFRILPEKLCPRLPSVPKHVNRSGLEELNNEETLEVNLLPQANIVQTMMAQLQESRSLEACSSNWTVPSNLNREYMSSRVYNSYAVSQEHLPVKPPPLDPEAQAIGMIIPTQTLVPTKTLERWEARSRMATNIASHSDHFIATLDRLLKDEKVSSVAVNRIMSALDKSKTKILGLSLHNATEILTTRRDATLDFKSTSLLKGSKDVLRATPLSSKTLFNGKVKDVTASDLAEHTRLCSAQLMRGGTKRNAQPSNSNQRIRRLRLFSTLRNNLNKVLQNLMLLRNNNVLMDNSRDPSLKHIRLLLLYLRLCLRESHLSTAILLPDVTVGGRLSLFLKEWWSITKDSLMLSIIEEGYYLHFQLYHHCRVFPYIFFTNIWHCQK